ncbi:hypothetical protein BJ546DRAFT_1097216 [Cryomyces antarcticus]
MALLELDNNENSVELPSPYEIIFSCSVCQDTIVDIYKNAESSNTIHDGRNSDEREVTKLWLTDCVHLTCGKHLEGGGAPFHPEDEPPRAPCPLCSAEKNDRSLKSLYGIRGCWEGAYDPMIPKAWFDTPPIKLDGSQPGMDALRFHYLSLVRFGTMTLRKLQKAQRAKDEMEHQAASDASRCRHLEAEIRDMKSRIKGLEKNESELKSWKAREPAIKHYLGVVELMAKDIDRMEQQLTYLGYAVPKTSYGFKPPTEGETAGGQGRAGSTQHGGDTAMDSRASKQYKPSNPSSRSHRRPDFISFVGKEEEGSRIHGA